MDRELGRGPVQGGLAVFELVWKCHQTLPEVKKVRYPLVQHLHHLRVCLRMTINGC